jgi:hypothetical protein
MLFNINTNFCSIFDNKLITNVMKDYSIYLFNQMIMFVKEVDSYSKEEM